MTSTNDKTKFNVGDIIEVSMKIEYQIPEEDETKPVIDLSDYPTIYEIDYSYPKEKGFRNIDFTFDAGCSACFNDDIKQYLEEYLKEDMKEIAEYELFDIDNKGEYQTAKIKITKLA